MQLESSTILNCRLSLTAEASFTSILKQLEWKVGLGVKMAVVFHPGVLGLNFSFGLWWQLFSKHQVMD